jgi:hypothetical protein
MDIERALREGSIDQKQYAELLAKQGARSETEEPEETEEASSGASDEEG